MKQRDVELYEAMLTAHVRFFEEKEATVERNERAEEYARGNEGFYEWLCDIDEVVIEVLGLSLFDLQDMMLISEYEAGSTPPEALRDLVAETVRECLGEDALDMLLDAL